jgi:type I restriction enzyme S subunit
MEVRKGYKQTEVGVVPEDWKIKPLGELTTLMTNGFVGPVTRHYAENGNGVLYIQGYNVEENSFNFHGIKYVTEEFHHAHMKSCLRTGDLLTIQTGEVGLTTIVPEDLAGSNCHALIISRFDKKYTSPHYVSYYLNSKPGRARLRLIETGTTMKHLNVGDVLHFVISLPPTLAEQEAIAKALSDADALIESLETLLAKKRQVKQGAMSELLAGKRRLKGFTNTNKYKQTDVGLIPDDWEIKRLGDIGTSIIGLTYKPTDVRDAGTLVLRSSNVQEGVLSFEDNVFVEMEISEKLMVLPGDILICVRNGSRDLIGKCAHIDDRAKGMTFGAFMTVFRSPFHAFVFHQFQSRIIKKQIHEHLGATINQITNKSLNSFVVPLPPTQEEQTAIAEILSDMDAEIRTVEEKLSKARGVKAGMMSELLTGRVRLV